MDIKDFCRDVGANLHVRWDRKSGMWCASIPSLQVKDGGHYTTQSVFGINNTPDLAIMILVGVISGRKGRLSRGRGPFMIPTLSYNGTSVGLGLKEKIMPSPATGHVSGKSKPLF